MPRSLATALLAALLSTACSDDKDGGGGDNAAPLDCAWLESDNCWRATGALAAADCLPSVAAFGTFNANNTVCTYADGTTITFDEPVPLPIPVDTSLDWRFTVATGGATCLRYEGTLARRTLTVSDQIYSEMAVAEGIQVSCPDGTIYRTESDGAIAECRADFRRESFSSNTTSVVMGLRGAGQNGSELPIFDCRTP